MSGMFFAKIGHDLPKILPVCSRIFKIFTVWQHNSVDGSPAIRYSTHVTIKEDITMKLICVILSLIQLLGTISGCRRAPQETTGS